MQQHKLDEGISIISQGRPGRLNTPEEAPLRKPKDILKEMKALDKESTKLMDKLQLIIENEENNG